MTATLINSQAPLSSFAWMVLTQMSGPAWDSASLSIKFAYCSHVKKLVEARLSGTVSPGTDSTCSLTSHNLTGWEMLTTMGQSQGRRALLRHYQEVRSSQPSVTSLPLSLHFLSRDLASDTSQDDEKHDREEASPLGTPERSTLLHHDSPGCSGTLPVSPGPNWPSKCSPWRLYFIPQLAMACSIPGNANATEPLQTSGP